jgi:hypothetical protein
MEQPQLAWENANELVAQQPNIPAYQDILARAQGEFGSRLLQAGRAEEATVLLASALDHARQQFRDHPDDARKRMDLTVLRLQQARCLHRLGRAEAARLLAAEVVDEVLDLLDPEQRSVYRGTEPGWLGRVIGMRPRPGAGAGPGQEPAKPEFVRLLDDLGMTDAGAEKLRLLLRRGR